jgi:deazaflavin-dependent oxidoreductase (nitroreductase family)
MLDHVRRAAAVLGARALQTRWFVRAPIWLYRGGIGFLCGHRLLMLEHIGRDTGRHRFVVLEVVDQPAPDEYVIVSGFGRRAHWYRNILADPKVLVSCGFRRNVAATAIAMTDQESTDALQRYAEHHPTAWENLRATIEAAVGRPVDGLPMVTLKLNLTP